MEILSLIYTQKINRKILNDFFENNDEISLYKRNTKEEVYTFIAKDISIMTNSIKIEIMYGDKWRNDVINLIKKLLAFNNSKSVSIKFYNNKEKTNFMHLLAGQKCYFV